MNGQTLSPEFTKVWETHYLAKTPEPEANKEHKNENKETIVQKTTTVNEEPPTTGNSQKDAVFTPYFGSSILTFQKKILWQLLRLAKNVFSPKLRSV